MPYSSKNDNHTEIGLSVVIPLFNESLMIEPLIKRLTKVLSQLDEHCEIVFVDDGSNDDSWFKVNKLPLANNEYQCIKLSRNFGKEAAMSAGLIYARGLAVIMLDADLQDPPELIPDMLTEWRAGYDIVNMKRKKRLGETFFKRLSAHGFYKLFNWMSDASLPENVGDFRLMSRLVVDSINALPERNRFMKGLFNWPGFTQKTLEFERDPRFVGETKWNYGKLFALAMDGITSFSLKPLRISSWCGVITAISAFTYGGWIVISTLIFGENVEGYPSLMVVQLALAGIQLLALGLIGEYLGRVFIEVKQRPIYLIKEVTYKESLTQVQKRIGHSPIVAKAAQGNVTYLEVNNDQD